MADLSTSAVPKTAALYIRVSTHSQEELSPDSQKRLLLDYAAAHHMNVSSQFIYQENGISGRTAEKRPRFQEMIAAAKSQEHPFDVILVWKYSRFARNQEESIVYKSMLRNKCHVDVISISEPLADGPFGTLIERIIEWMDEFYSIRLSGDVKRGMTEKAIRGGSQSRMPFGYRIPYHNALPEVVEEEARIVTMIFEKYVLYRLSLFSIARELNALGFRTSLGNPFGKRAVEYILSNPFYAGDVRWNRRGRDGKLNNREDWIITTGSHPPIISRELFSAAQERLEKERTLSKNSRPAEISKHWLSGILKCPHCGRSLSSCVRKRKTKERTYFFQCSGYLKGKCPYSSYFSAESLIPSVLQAVKEASSFREKEMDCQYELSPPDETSFCWELQEISHRISQLRIKEDRAKEAYLEGIEEKESYAEIKRRIQEEKGQLENRIQSLEECRNFETNFHAPPDLYQILSSPSYTNAQKNAALKRVVKKIVCFKDSSHIDVFYNYFPQG